MTPYKKIFKESSDLPSDLQYKDTGKLLVIKLEYGTYPDGEGYDERVYRTIQDYGGNYTTDRGDKPKYLYFADSKKTGVTKEEMAKVINGMGYSLYLKSDVDSDEVPVKIELKDI
jgi:hypothetical protein